LQNLFHIRLSFMMSNLTNPRIPDVHRSQFRIIASPMGVNSRSMRLEISALSAALPPQFEK